MIDRDHPAVEAGAEGMEYPHTPTAHDAIVAALPHLTEATPENLALFRDTPLGRELKAEGWDEGAGATNRAWEHAYDGHPVDSDLPYYECQTCNTTNPYLEEN